MERKLLVFAFLFAFCMSVFAQTVSTAKQINNIKRNKKYIYAESVDSLEQNAYSAAKSELQDKIDSYIQNSGLIDGANTIIVKDIKKYVNKLTLQRDITHYVFLYVKRSDIIKSESEVETISVVENGGDVTQQTINTAEILDTKTADTLKGTPAENITGIVEEPVKQQPNAISCDYLLRLPEYRRDMIRNIFGSKDLFQVQNIIRKEVLVDYGVKTDCPNPEKVYWVVNAKDGITVLSPVQGANRVNIKTGKADSLENYMDGFWFRFK